MRVVNEAAAADEELRVTNAIRLLINFSGPSGVDYDKLVKHYESVGYEDIGLAKRCIAKVMAEKGMKMIKGKK